MTWTEDSANLRRDLSFLATMEMGSKVGSFRSASEEDNNEGDENSSETLEVLDDLSIFCFALDSNAETGRQRPVCFGFYFFLVQLGNSRKRKYKAGKFLAFCQKSLQSCLIHS